uniref:Uncharacterized protein n=1 Tax=Oscillatoriales cyanobacterium SpSt-402 TaxID=2282168 RepID=A0A832H357_9CYAN
MFPVSETPTLSTSIAPSSLDTTVLHSQASSLHSSLLTELNDPLSTTLSLSRSSVSLDRTVSFDTSFGTSDVFGNPNYAVSFPASPDLPMLKPEQVTFNEVDVNAIALPDSQTLDFQLLVPSDYLNPQLNIPVPDMGSGWQVSPEVEAVYIQVNTETLFQNVADVTSYTFTIGSSAASELYVSS